MALRKRLLRDRFAAFLAQLPQATVVMNACGTAHYWARRIEELGHVVVLLPSQYVRPYVVRNKTDRTDVDALLEAFRNQQIRPVPIKTITQQVVATLHRLRSVPGIGLLSATALYAFIGDPSRFPSGRHMASFVGLTPREYSSGLRRRLGRISKRGDAYLRPLLIHGARSILYHAKRMKHRDRLPSWALRLERKGGHNKAPAALANKLARITWAVWTNDRNFEPLFEP